MKKNAFIDNRRQIYLDEESYRNTVAQLEDENALDSPVDLSPADRCTDLRLAAYGGWIIFQLRYTAGESLTSLADSLENVVVAYEHWVDALDEVSDEDYAPPFIMDDLIDTYVDYLNILSVAVLLRREDLIGRICALNEGTDFDRVDAVLEELLKFFLPDRPELDYLLWKNPYHKLLNAIDSDNPDEMAAEMKRYVQTWYASMKGKAHFWGKHEKIKPAFTPYYGYWTMCAAAFTYLYDIDDTSYRHETVYPRDLVNYARSIPRHDRPLDAATRPLRVAGNEPCSKSGQWFTPARADSPTYFTKGDIMPDFPDAPYGLTIWQWIDA
jgi:hypothetical protein